MHTFHLDAPRVRVFPLFTPCGEREWAADWDPVILSGAKERGSAFITRNHLDQTSTWIVIEYNPTEARVSYARLAHGSNIGLVDVICTEPASGGTDVSVAYTLTPLQAGAEACVDDFLDPQHYARTIEEWKAAISAALAAQSAQGQSPRLR
ncbi:MAG: hypothetical protein NVS1B6_02550 [Steroidobacteraceae bacterium]